jgi:2'-hydroxyisoflavone reductase
VKLLVIGGTRFFGRGAVEHAVRRGHEVTVFHRGEWEPEGFPDVEHVHGDRRSSLEPLAGRAFDAVLDTWAFVPREVRELGEALGDAIGHYTFVSSLSVHPDDLPVGADEDTPVHPPPYPETEDVTDEAYGPLKVASELQARASFPGRALVIRPGYIVGPHDPTDRLTWWARRAASGGRMAAAGPSDAPIQGIDARDLGAFVIERIEAGDAGTYGVVGPDEPATFGDLVDAARVAGGADTEIVWLDPATVRAAGDDHETWFPLWHPDQPGFHAYDASRARAAGLRPRPFAETVADTVAWDRERGLPPLKVGLPPERERELLAAWDRAAG